MINENVKKSIDNIKKVQGEINNNPEFSKEENKLGNVLFNQITECSIEILKNPEINKALKNIENEHDLKESSITSLINIIAIAMSESAYNAILFYDDLLKKELQRQIDHIGNHINTSKSDIEGMKSVLLIHQKRIEELKNNLIAKDIKENN